MKKHIRCRPRNYALCVCIAEHPERTVKHKAVDMSNEEFLGFIYTFADSGFNTETELVIEMPEARGMPVGKDVFETIYWVGRFCEAWFGKGDGVFHRAYPRDIRSFFVRYNSSEKGECPSGVD